MLTTTLQVCAEGGVLEGAVTRVEIEGLVLAVYRVEGEVFVTDDQCTHGPGLMSEGFLEGHVIECDFHGGCFDIRSGAVVTPPCMIPLRTYPARLVDGMVVIDLASD